MSAADAMIGKAREAMATQQLHQVLNAVWAVVADANRYFAGEAPWALAKTDPPRQGTVLYVTAEVLRQIAILALPFMPEFGGKTARSVGCSGERADLCFSRRQAPDCRGRETSGAGGGLSALCRAREAGGAIANKKTGCK